jgi:hypothetical protein
MYVFFEVVSWWDENAGHYGATVMSLPRSFMPSMRSMQHLVLLVLLISPEQVICKES